MYRLGTWILVVLVFCILGARQATAGVSFQPATPDELNLKSEPLAPGAPAIILFREVDRDDNVRRLMKTITFA